MINDLHNIELIDFTKIFPYMSGRVRQAAQRPCENTSDYICIVIERTS